jgi:hypothetical protein
MQHLVTATTWNVKAYGKVPRSAKAPGVPPAAAHLAIISPRARALSRLPAASRCGSAAVYAPSTNRCVSARTMI